MIETHRLKNVVIFIHTILNFVLSRKIINIANYCDIFIMITKIIVTIKILKLLSLLLLVLFIYIHIHLFIFINIYIHLSKLSLLLQILGSDYIFKPFLKNCFLLDFIFHCNFNVLPAKYIHTCIHYKYNKFISSDDIILARNLLPLATHFGLIWPKKTYKFQSSEPQFHFLEPI